MESSYRRLGNCACAFWLAIAFDIFGMLILLTGVFANVFFYDFLIYAGAIIIFLSLIWWVFWYTGNIEVPPEELEDDIGLPPKKPNEGITGTVRSLSRRLSHGILHSLRNRTHRTFGDPRAFPRDGQQPAGSPPAPLTTLPREDVHTVSEFVKFDTQTSEAFPNI
ncbi:Transmembrane protein 238 [Merluccius polli]|uniref:Transmembrane protein 238 n=1 Tax=Merluccius polli TaxID=89951 RepID=A0AA47MSP6_MERPO|nr:Transmembrane protein 238 [Merluccius polli]